jgi:hypothetical protein
MASADFEAAFSQFIESREYEQEQNVIFALVRLAFKAGWEAAGGEPPTVTSVIEFPIDRIEK